jgi:hypothetical protein
MRIEILHLSMDLMYKTVKVRDKREQLDCIGEILKISPSLNPETMIEVLLPSELLVMDVLIDRDVLLPMTRGRLSILTGVEEVDEDAMEMSLLLAVPF